jgi:hypothetical protein
VKGIRRLFLPRVGIKGSVAHMFREFQDSIEDSRITAGCSGPDQITAKQYRLGDVAAAAHERQEILPAELGALRVILIELLSDEICAEWLGYNYLSRPDEKPLVRPLAPWIREPDWGKEENINKLRIYRAAVFISCIRPDELDWQTPRVADMELVWKFIENFTRPHISAGYQMDMIYDVFNPHVSLERICRPERGPRLNLSDDDIRYIWETRHLSHEDRAAAWDNRSPRPFHPFGRPNVEMYRDQTSQCKWRVAVNRLVKKALLQIDPDIN